VEITSAAKDLSHLGKITALPRTVTPTVRRVRHPTPLALSGSLLPSLAASLLVSPAAHAVESTLSTTTVIGRLRVVVLLQVVPRQQLLLSLLNQQLPLQRRLKSESALTI